MASVVPNNFLKSPEFSGGNKSSKDVSAEVEFDFSDVFGPENPTEESRDESQDYETAEGTVLNEGLTWAPIDSISGGKPLVINHRSHSLVGPAFVHAGSLGRSLGHLTDLHARMAKREIELPEGRPLSDGLMRSTLIQRDETKADNSEFSRNASSSSEEKLPGNVMLDFCGEIPAQEKKIGPEDFELLRVVGQGAFGKVFQVQKKDTGEIFAMKVMRKDKIKEKNHGDYMKAERDILTKAIHPFIVQLQYSFQVKYTSILH